MLYEMYHVAMAVIINGEYTKQLYIINPSGMHEYKLNAKRVAIAYFQQVYTPTLTACTNSLSGYTCDLASPMLP